MDSLMQSTVDEEEERRSKLSHQALWFALHTLLALAVWAGLMLAGYALNPPEVPQFVILMVSIAVPLVGYFIVRVRQDEMASLVWLIGLVWLMIIAIWIVDMPTGPNQCFQCDITSKLSRTFFSIPTPSGLIDDDGPFIATWPAAALLGYSIGARLAMKKKTYETD
jgi:FtsH-binding integral membrane protein